MDNKQKIINILETIIKKNNWNSKVILTNSRGHGDFSTNLPLTLKSQLNLTTENIAKIITDSINFEDSIIQRIEFVEPGFLNFFIKNNQVAEEINKIIELNGEYGFLSQNQKINLEYVSVNPTGFVHIAHARAAAYGSTLANILSFAGNKVISEYYINDYGNQIDRLAISVFTRYLQLNNVEIEMPEDSYIGDDIKLVASIIFEKNANKFLNSKFEDVKEFFRNESVEILLNFIKEDLNTFRVNMDIYFSEKSLYEKNAILPIINKLQDTYQKNNATWLKTTKYGDDKDRVLIKEDGTFTYFLPDIAYHDKKAVTPEKQDLLINIWGADHIGYVKRLSIAYQLLGHDSEKLKVIITQIIKLVKNGQEFKMSKRKGNAISLRELIEMVGVDAARFYLINHSSNSGIDFDIDLVQEQTTNNPVFLVQYTHARTVQLLNKSQKNIYHATEFNNDNEKEIINVLQEFPRLIEVISKTYKVNLLPQYLINLSKTFNSFYSNSKIIGNINEDSLLALTKAVQLTLKQGLNLMGVSSPERM